MRCHNCDDDHIARQLKNKPRLSLLRRVRDEVRGPVLEQSGEDTLRRERNEALPAGTLLGRAEANRTRTMAAKEITGQ